MSFLTDSTSSQLNFASTIASITSRCILQPIDVAKTRLQLQQYSSTGSKYKGMTQCMKMILKEEGTKSLWKGHTSAQLLSLIYNNTFYLSYKYVSNIISNLESIDISRQRPFISGGIAGTISMLVSHPFDLVRTRMITQFSNDKMYKTTLQAFQIIYKYNGIKGFYRGFFPSVVEIFFHSGLQFTIFEYIEKLNLQKYDGSFYSNVLGFLVGGISGTIPKVILIPITIVKKRKQTSGFERNFIYMGQPQYYHLSSFQWFKHSIKQSMLTKTLYAGTSPTIIKAFLYSAFHLSIMKMLLVGNQITNS